ncbi:xanthine/uracil/vitamin C permease [Alkalihalobacillus sp. MEB130]|uniref:xanthine/uracil/vitamin C permease n=1 Tax=Alkalihalobacillus sp. MEB130 TaxID=2976704 RepID=UPI0028DF979F|nr:xanthine/uracil/vitamin C permease [Alkalihalobacillus sp. MEB130]MDT8862173.1 xanthine/uracil/vitamin C permease [Alkalihalobacillus sp. MEB130]
MSSNDNKDRNELPYWPMGPFKLRLPFFHYRLEKPEIIQGFVLFSIGLSIIPLLQNQVGMSYEAALAIVIVMHITMIMQTALGSPFVPGLITPLIPLIVLFLADFEPGPEAIQALVAVQLLVAFIFLLLGITGLGKILVKKLSQSLKAGILIGAGLAAFIGEFEPGGRVAETPISLIIGGAICLFIMFSPTFKTLYQKSSIARFIANFGIMPAILVAIAIGWLVKEYPTPSVEWGITTPNFVELWNYTPFVIGFPSLDVFVLALPIAILGYIIAYGDIIVGTTLIERAEKYRKDEVIDNNVTTLHFITFIRNLMHALIAPHPGLAGPIFTAGTASIVERYTYGKKAMQSIFSGTNTLVLSLFVSCFVLPLVSFFQPFLPIALSITLILTGYLCITLGMEQVTTNVARGVAIIMAVVLAVYGAAHALVVGLVLYFVIEKGWFATTKEHEKDEKKAS